MLRLGPYYRRKPTTYTLTRHMAWCYFWLDEDGNVIAIEWVG